MDIVVDAATNVREDERKQARIDLAAAHQLAVTHDFHEGIDNHFTLNVPGRPGHFYLNPWGLHWSEVTGSKLIEVTYEGEVTAGNALADRSAVCIHAPIHRLVPGAECVLHTHMPYATALTQLEDMTLEMTGQSALFFLDKIAYDREYNGFADDLAEGERMARLMGDKPILMMANHGVVVTGKTVAAAYHRLYFLERACRTQLFSMWTGQRRKFVSDAAMDKVREQMRAGDPQLAMSPADYFFTAMKRLLDRQGSDYAA
ncbi:MAG: class II aldolase/adducin family protein [Proteobacteria bacterium]|nr:class II aldolase/adducin family protein [Pseudomonadota bacterium]